MMYQALVLCMCCVVCLPGVIKCQGDSEQLQRDKGVGIDSPELVQRHERGLPMDLNKISANDNDNNNIGDVIHKEENNLEPQDEAGPQEKDIPDQTSVDDHKSAAEEKSGEGLGFMHGFLASISVIIVSEIGDKTFFIAAIMAMKYSRWLVFAGALSALGFMTFLSVCLGYATMIIPRSVTFYGCTALLALFGVKMLYEGYKMSRDEGQEELEEVTEELRKREETLSQTTPPDAEQGLTTVPPLRRRLRLLGPFVSPIFIQAFTLTFLAEWGDRSQLTTIVLGARENPLGVTLGGTLGHALCTAIAVIGGKIVAQRISVKTVTIIGGVVFLVFALTAFLHDPTAL